jgi:type I restriction enzyme S subunit
MKFPAYEIYVASKLEWLDEIPIDWDVIPIKFGLEIPITDGPHETPEIFSDGIPFLSAEAVKKDKLDFNRKRGFISLEEHERFSKKYKPKRGDVYMVKSGATTGNMARVETDVEFNIWSPLAAMRPDKGVLTTDFLFYFMKSKPFFHSVELNWSYGTQQNIGMGVISNLQMALPPVPIQKKIAAFLEYKTQQIDLLINKKKVLIEKLEEKRIAVITQAVTKGINNKSKLKPSGVDWLGDIPAHWDVTRTKFNVTRIGSGKTPSGGAEVYVEDGIMMLRSQNVYDDGLRLSNVVHITEESDSLQLSSRIHDYDVLLNITGASIGRASIIPSGFPISNVNQHVCIVRPKQEKIDPRYLHLQLCSHIAKYQIMMNQVGTSREGLTFPQVGDLTFSLPDLVEQIKILEFCENETIKNKRMRQKVDLAISKLEEYRSAIITSAVTGKVDVSEINIPKEFA